MTAGLMELMRHYIDEYGGGCGDEEIWNEIGL
jgi:hypothetical protein